jgi:maltooligosyltrehalose trehalohydrolase
MERKLPVGAEIQRGGGVHFRVWAPESKRVAVELDDGGAVSSHSLAAEGSGYFSGLVEAATARSLYKFQLDSGSYPDPASRFQPEGPHGSSQVIDPASFPWTDQGWKGLPVKELVIYELHVGTFTREGTWRAAAEELDELKRLGITMIELMPVAEFPGRFGWGYDGVDLFAPTRLYGKPDDFRAFVDRAHALGIMVILDVVYNHFGPDGNYLSHFSRDYFSTKYSCEWGQALNYDGANAFGLRELVASNARYWVDEFHLDGLRLDATQQLFDGSTSHIIAEIARAARAAARDRQIYLVGENEPQDARLARSPDDGGHGLDALWNDDYHHCAMVAATGRSEAYYTDYRGAPQEFISTAKHGFLYQGQWYGWQKKRRGAPALDLSPGNFVVFLQNHDQVANSLRGERLHKVAAPAELRALTALTLLHPATPMLFQGQEFAATTPFLYFADHAPEINKLVQQGRAEFLAQFRTVACEENRALLADPGSEGTFGRSKLDFADRERNAEIYRLHGDLLRLRREDPVLRETAFVDGAVLGEEAFVLRYFSAAGDRLLLVNLGHDLRLNPSPEPLLAPLEGKGWRVLWSSEGQEYGGGGTPPLEIQGGWMIPGEAAVLMEPDENRELPKIKLSQND